MSKRRARFYGLLALVAGVALAVALTSYALRDNLSYFRTPTEIVSGQYPEKTSGRALRIGGLVEQGSVQRENGTLRFSVTDMQNHLSVMYSGVVPDLFREGQGVVAEGKVGSDGVFTASKILAKHDEKYTPPEVKRALAPR